MLSRIVFVKEIHIINSYGIFCSWIGFIHFECVPVNRISKGAVCDVYLGKSNKYFLA